MGAVFDASVGVIAVTGRFTHIDGSPNPGTVTFDPLETLVDAAGNVIVSGPLQVTTNSSGILSVNLPYTDSARLTSEPFTYLVTESMTGREPYFISLPTSMGSTVDLADLVPGAPAAAVVFFGGLTTPNTWTAANTFNGPVTFDGPVSLIPGLLPSGDGTGATDTAAIQALINLGAQVVQLAPGAFTIGAAGLTPHSFMRLTGAGYGHTTLTTTSGPLINAGTAFTDTVEIDHVTLQATGFDIFAGVNCARWHVHDCQFTQNSAGNAIWNGTTSGSGVMLECRFERNTENVSGATRTIEAWFLSSASGSTQLNQNAWRDNVCWNLGNDQAMYWYHLQSTGANNAGNMFENIVFEHPFGGMIWLESATRSLISQCYAYDCATAAGTISNHLVQFSKNAGGSASNRNTIINGVRNQGGVTFASNIGDIGLDANCQQTTITTVSASGDLALYLGGSTGVKLVNVGAASGNAVKDSATTAAAGSASGGSPPVPVCTAGPTNESGTVTFGTGTAPSAGVQAVVTFGTKFTSTPTVVVTAFNGISWSLGLSLSAPSSTGFSVSSVSAPSASQGNGTYGFRWVAVA